MSRVVRYIIEKATLNDNSRMAFNKIKLLRINKTKGPARS